ncbi:uncharacterized protein LOC134823633 [Bolinopsis microptera]|uniref:uncharacterized protein LOC134823633 n=1 Tax=Bolinopsis microptera TaxID=2820187 RepID=UPI003079CF28
MLMSSDHMIMKIKIILFTTLLWLPIQGKIIGEVDGEIKPVSVSMTKASSSHVASNAIDRNTNTVAYSQGSDSWYFPVSVYSEDGTVPDNAASDCMIGDTVKFDGSRHGDTQVYALVIIGRAPDCSTPIIEKGTVTPDSEIYSGATFNVLCDNGFVISGSSTITCTNGELSTTPTCVPVATVTCDEKEMKLTLAEKSSFDTIRLNEKDCEFTGEVQEIKTDLEKCGTKTSFNSTHVIYKNQMTGITKTIDPTNGITREFKIAFECSYSRTGQIIKIFTERRSMHLIRLKELPL